MPFRALFTKKVPTKVCDWWQARCWARNCHANRPQHIGNHGKCHGQVDPNILNPSCCAWIWLICLEPPENGSVLVSLFLGRQFSGLYYFYLPSTTFYYSWMTMTPLTLAFFTISTVGRVSATASGQKALHYILQATPSLAQFMRMSNQQLHVTQIQVCQVQISGLSNPLVKEMLAKRSFVPQPGTIWPICKYYI